MLDLCGLGKTEKSRTIAWLTAGIDNNFIFFFSFFMKNVMKAEDSRIALDFYLQYEDKNYREVEKIALTAFLELPAEELKKMSKESKIICRRSLPEYFLTSRKYSKKNLAIS
jgi:ribosomal protein L37E